MAIRVIGGIPGAGKTYYAIWHLLQKYFHWSEDVDEYVAVDPSVRVIHNIDSLLLGESLEPLIEAAGGVTTFFTRKYQEDNFPGRVVYLIDEAQRLFDSRFHDKEVFYFFQYHRHLGQDIYLIVQDESHLAKGLRNLAEYYIRAVRRSLSLFGGFRYKFFDSPDSGEAFRTKSLRRDRRIFRLYSSMVAEEFEKIGSIPRRFVFIFLLLIALLVGGFYWFIGRFSGSGFQKNAVVSSESLKKMKADKLKPRILGRVPVVPSEDINPVSVGEVSVVGIFQVGMARTFLVSSGSAQGRFSEGELFKFCRCHSEMVGMGDTIPWFSSNLFPTQGAGRAGGDAKAAKP